MVIFFGPAGAGKSIQGQMLAARQGWRWLSMGQLLRDTRDADLFRTMQEGKLVPSDKANQIIENALRNAPNLDKLILDGYPRSLDQAKWLIEHQPAGGRSIGLIVVLEVPRAEIMKRLELRGRADDNPEAIEERLHYYRQEMYPILGYFNEQGINIEHVDGSGTVGQVHDRVMEVLTECKLV